MRDRENYDNGMFAGIVGTLVVLSILAAFILIVKDQTTSKTQKEMIQFTSKIDTLAETYQSVKSTTNANDAITLYAKQLKVLTTQHLNKLKTIK